MDVSLRPARPDDLSAVIGLLHACKLAINEVDRQFGPGFVVATAADGTVVAATGIERYGPDGLLRSAAVDPRWQRAGLGSRLTADRIAWSRREGLRALYLLTETAAEYWPRFGFERIARDSAPEPIRQSVEWAGGCPASAVAMKLDLGA